MTSDQVTELTTLMSDMKDKNIFEDFVKELDLSEARKQIEEKSKDYGKMLKLLQWTLVFDHGCIWRKF